MSGAGALLYLEWRQIVNRVTSALRSPGRMLLYALGIGYFVFISAMRAHRHYPNLALPEPFASAAFFTFITLLGIVAYGAASGIAGAFSSNADARFLIGSALNERMVVLWLQARRSANTMARMIFSLLFYALVFSGSASVLGITFAVLGAAMVASAVSVPTLKLRLTIGTLTTQALAGAIAAIGLLPIIVLFGSTVVPIRAATGIEHLGAGAAVNALIAGDPRALSALYAFGLLVFLGAWLSGSGLYPDLYAASLRTIAFRQRGRRGASAAFTVEHAYTNRSAAGFLYRLFDRLRGSWAIAWKEWIAFARSPGLQRTFWFGLLGSGGIGYILGSMAMRSAHPEESAIVYASTAANIMVIFLAMGSAVTLGNDLRKPLWWIGRDPLWTRLLAWACGTSWRMGAVVYAGILTWALAMHLPALAAFGIPIALTGVVYLRAVGLVIYSLFPSTVDQRGPLAMIRALLTYALAIPPMLIGTVVAIFFRNLALGSICGIATALGTSFLLVLFAASRITGRGVMFAQAEGL